MCDDGMWEFDDRTLREFYTLGASIRERAQAQACINIAHSASIGLKRIAR